MQLQSRRRTPKAILSRLRLGPEFLLALRQTFDRDPGVLRRVLFGYAGFPSLSFGPEA